MLERMLEKAESLTGWVIAGILIILGIMSFIFWMKDRPKRGNHREYRKWRKQHEEIERSIR